MVWDTAWLQQHILKDCSLCGTWENDGCSTAGLPGSQTFAREELTERHWANCSQGVQAGLRALLAVPAQLLLWGSAASSRKLV